MMVNNKEIRVRFAPSPTGHLHVGNSRVAIFNWLFAKHNNGKYLLRIENTDVERSTKEYLNSQLASLEWLDLLPDEPILYQMSRLEEHKKVINELLEKGLAYPCFCDPVELDKKRAEFMQAGKTYKYNGACRNLKYSKDDKRLNEPHAIRFKVPSDCNFVEFEDLVRGKVRLDSEYLDDFVIMRRDGTPTYNFVVVVDDIYMKISHVIRGEDHISNTHKQILIYNALEAEIPKFAHLPMILGPGGKRLSKRDAATSVKDYRKQGFLPDALFNYLVRLGWSHGDQEVFTKEEMIKYFEFDHVGKKGAIFDIKKLEWLNGVYLRKKSFEELLNAIKDLNTNYHQKIQELWDADKLKSLFEQYKQRSTRLLDMVLDIISLSKDPKVLDLELIKKWHNSKTLELLKKFLEKFKNVENISHDNLLDLAKIICKEQELKLVFLAQPLRLALTGKISSPGIFNLISILGKNITVRRVSALINKLENKE
ncbi:glutamate--tRNA ligase [Candidatus Dependentiae bacterium]|nr:glutamate--tRNA ligase [Candidatus Dependentiae bacterium]